MNTINKDTKLYGSFSSNPGNNGCIFFNNKFQQDGINAIYKSFYSNDIESTIKSIKHLNFSGFALSMPLKISVIDHLDEFDEPVVQIGACNTVINSNGTLYGYNTDWIGVYNYLLPNKPESLSILGNGGFGKAVKYACIQLNIPYQFILRENWDSVSNLEGTVFNATPVDVNVKGNLIDGRPFTKTGKEIANLQAEEQYKIYKKWM